MISLKVDFATMTKNYEDAQIGTGASLEMESVRTAEAATSITKDTGSYQSKFLLRHRVILYSKKHLYTCMRNSPLHEI